MKYIQPCFSAALLIVAVSCSKEKPEDNINPPEPRSVRYEISCNDCFVAWYKQGEVQESANHENSNWQYTFEADSGQIVLVAAYNTDSVPTVVGASIYLNNVLLKSAENFCPISGVVLVSDTLQ